MSSLCKDDKCLFKAQRENSNEKSFSTVATQTREGIGLWEKCNLCNLVINRTGVVIDEIENFYNKEYQEKNSFIKEKSDIRIDTRKHFEIRKESINDRVVFLEKHLSKNMSVFEFGGGSGELLFLIKDKVKNVYANEINLDFVNFMNEELGIIATSEDYLKLDNNENFDFIISVGTLDHIFNPGVVLEKFYKDLKNNGLLYIEVPNDEQALKTQIPIKSRENFKNFMYQKAHYYSFTFDTLEKLLIDKGFEIVNKHSRHDYNIINYLNWIFKGHPQESIVDAKSGVIIHKNENSYSNRMNDLFEEMNHKFKKIITNEFLGESICILAKKIII
jgi:SAM-dependent methyltransferase